VSIGVVHLKKLQHSDRHCKIGGFRRNSASNFAFLDDNLTTRGRFYDDFRTDNPPPVPRRHLLCPLIIYAYDLITWFDYWLFVRLTVLEAPRPMGLSFPTWCAKLTGLTESADKEDPSTYPRPFRLPVGIGGRQGWGHVPKAHGLKRRGRGPRQCNGEGARGGWQTDKQTDRLVGCYVNRRSWLCAVSCRWCVNSSRKLTPRSGRSICHSAYLSAHAPSHLV